MMVVDFVVFAARISLRCNEYKEAIIYANPALSMKTLHPEGDPLVMLSLDYDIYIYLLMIVHFARLFLGQSVWTSFQTLD